MPPRKVLKLDSLNAISCVPSAEVSKIRLTSILINKYKIIQFIYSSENNYFWPQTKPMRYFLFLFLLLELGGGQGDLNLPLPVPFNPGSRPVLFGSHHFAFFRLRNIAQCCTIFPFFSRFPPPWESRFPLPLLPPPAPFSPGLPPPFPPPTLEIMLSSQIQSW